MCGAIIVLNKKYRVIANKGVSGFGQIDINDGFYLVFDLEGFLNASSEDKLVILKSNYIGKEILEDGAKNSSGESVFVFKNKLRLKEFIQSLNLEVDFLEYFAYHLDLNGVIFCAVQLNLQFNIYWVQGDVVCGFSVSEIDIDLVKNSLARCRLVSGV